MESLAPPAETINGRYCQSLAFRNADGGQNLDHDSLAFLEQHLENFFRSYSLMRHTYPHNEAF